jgi:hypothetical protein
MGPSRIVDQHNRLGWRIQESTGRYHEQGPEVLPVYAQVLTT